MKKFVSIILLTCLVAGMTSALAYSGYSDDYYDDYYGDYDYYDDDDYTSPGQGSYGSGKIVYCYTTSNIRSSHWLNRGNNVIGALPSGATAEYLGTTWIDVDSNNRPWYHIYYNGIEGWVSGKYTELRSSYDYGYGYDDDAGNGYYIND